MRFSKMEGLGNDFVVVAGDVHVTPDLVRSWCHRRFGIGADGVLRVGLEGALVTMEYWNADGSEAEMCGNGLRCVARYAVDRGLTGAHMFPVRTPDGVRDVRVGDDVVSVDLGPVAAAEQITIDDRTYRRVIMGNPHAVTKVADPEEVDVATIGPRVEHHPAFPEGTNVEFISELRDGGIRMRVWERGVGETLACGSGIVAAAAVARGHDPQVHVWVPGGIATVTFEDDAAWLTGPARFVFEGESVSGPA